MNASEVHRRNARLYSVTVGRQPDTAEEGRGTFLMVAYILHILCKLLLDEGSENADNTLANTG